MQNESRRFALTVGIAVGLGWPAAAAANMAAMTRSPGALDGPVTLEATAAEVAGETIRFDCDGTAFQAACAFEARYRLVNPSGEAQSLVGVFYGVGATGVTISSNGVDLRREPTAEERTVIDGRVAAVTGADEWLEEEDGHSSLTRHGFELALAAGASAEVVVSGAIQMEGRPVPSGWLSQVVTRHLLCGTEGRDPEVFDLEYLVAPIETWSAVGPVEVTVSLPASWEVRAESAESTDRWRLARADDDGWSRESRAERLVLRRTFRPEAGDRPAVLLVELQPDDPAPRFYHGGPLLGFGGGVTDGDPRFQMRFAYEVAAPQWLFYQVAVDSDFADRVTLAAVVEAVSPIPYLPLLPSLYAGLGLPVQVLPDTRVGIRLQTGLGWGPISFVASLDFYPGLDTGDAEFFQTLLLGVLSL